MHNYYLFIINNNAYKLYKNNPKYLYSILYTLYKLKDNDLVYGINLYKNICDIFSVKLLNNYLIERFNYKKKDNYIVINNRNRLTKIKLNYSRVIIKTNIKFPDILKIFNIYNKKIFIIDFKNNNYFWLNDKIELSKI